MKFRWFWLTFANVDVKIKIVSKVQSMKNYNVIVILNG
jgi:hypothetical protein